MTLRPRPQVRRDYPLSLSISISGGKETYKDSLSNGERTGNSPVLKIGGFAVRIVVWRSCPQRGRAQVPWKGAPERAKNYWRETIETSTARGKDEKDLFEKSVKECMKCLEEANGGRPDASQVDVERRKPAPESYGLGAWTVAELVAGGKARGLLICPWRCRRVDHEGFECEHACRDPKDGELCLSGAKPEETLVEARSDIDVQIVRLTWPAHPGIDLVGGRVQRLEEHRTSRGVRQGKLAEGTSAWASRIASPLTNLCWERILVSRAHGVVGQNRSPFDGRTN
ncbi:hypothetical protein Tco_0360177 [Tanacetum coccineum]